jgi:hypothetical protein
VKEADEGVIVVKSAADCDVAGKPRKKKVLLRKRGFRLDSRDKGTAPSLTDRHHETVDSGIIPTLAMNGGEEGGLPIAARMNRVNVVMSTIARGNEPAREPKPDLPGQVRRLRALVL